MVPRYARSVGHSPSVRWKNLRVPLVLGLDRNADDLNAVIRSLSPCIRSVTVLRVLRRHDSA